jgi:predicted dehydrogenase
MAKVPPVKVGLIGSGSISKTYLRNMTQEFSILDVVGCSDIIPERSKNRAEEFNIKQLTNEEIYEDPGIEIVVNTTYPLSHYEVTRDALLAGKNVYSEKMMAVTMDEARELVSIANEKGLRIGMAPDTFLGGGLQTARKIIDAGLIGEPLNAVAMVMRGYHMRGEIESDRLPFVMSPGGGIPFDLGGYYLHALIHLLGGVKRVSGFSKTREKDYVYENPRHPRYKESFNFDTPNMLTGALEFEQGCYGTITTISEAFGEIPRLEIYGTEGVLICNDPNTFGGPIYLKRNNGSWNQFPPYEIPLTHGYTEDFRGIGVADMAWAIRNNRPHRCSAELGFHAFEIINGIIESDRTGKVYEMTSKCERPAPLPSGFITGSFAEACLDN